MCAIENNMDDSKIEDVIRELFIKIEEDMRIKDAFKSVNYHSKYLIIDDDID